jgi:hypothetical protein
VTTDDIVTRLRNGDAMCRDGHVYELWAIEAADEIERLRQRHDTFNSQPFNWVHVAQRLVQYINDTGPRQFDGVLDALAYLDSLEAADGK